MDKKKVKIAYILLAASLMVCAVISAYFDQDYIALGFIVLASAVILAGAFLISYIYKFEKIKEID